FSIGAISGFISYLIFFFIASFLDITITFQVDIFYTPILFISCLVGIFLISGVVLRKLGMQNTIKLFSRDIPSNYDASKKLTAIPKWLSSIGYNVKISVLNTLRRRGEFKRYLIVFTTISLIIFTLGLGSTVLQYSSQEWIRKSQGTDVIAVGHKDVLQNYTLMYNMFSNPDILITQNDIDFLNPNYLFNLSKIEELTNYTEIERIDQRLVSFFNVTELDGYHLYEDGGYFVAGQDRETTIPIIGFNVSEILHDFEVEGEYIAEEDTNNMMIGDGLGHNLFDFPLDQSMRIEELGTGHPFQISAVVIDSFYSGFAGYVDLKVMQEDMNFSSNEINLLLLKVQSGEYGNIIENLELLIHGNLGENFSFVNLNQTFENNYSYLGLLTLYPLLIIIMMAIILTFTLYNYQKGNILEKAKDFLIMRAVGSKYRSIKKILFLEAFYMIVPSLFLSMGIGMMLNAFVLFDRVYLPNLSLPFIIIGILI
ncbi:MAG: FtsX-like permease family protein, partial [Candidatus Heimdallarchaeaceae archaeon]